MKKRIDIPEIASILLLLFGLAALSYSIIGYILPASIFEISSSPPTIKIQTDNPMAVVITALGIFAILVAIAIRISRKTTHTKPISQQK